MARGHEDERPSRLHKRSRRFKIETKALGLRVRRLRMARRWTLERAAERMDLDLKHLQKIEAGMLNVTFVTLVRIAAGLGEPIAALFPRVRSSGSAPRGKNSASE